jgi:membrane-bound lytic murein transglycosylase A
MIEELLRAPTKRTGDDPAAAAANRTAPPVHAAPPVATNKPVQAPPPVAANAAPPRPFEPSRLNSDPSYVFFKPSADQTSIPGPPGALGVPLTTGRSVAVDPRVVPLGYPVFLSAPAPPGSNIELRRLVFAQDTGGAIRGAGRADFFWGFGPDAGRLARGTRHRGQMWLLMPRAEASRLGSAGAVTRSIEPAKPASAECLVADADFCQ